MLEKVSEWEEEEDFEDKKIEERTTPGIELTEEGFHEVGKVIEEVI